MERHQAKFVGPSSPRKFHEGDAGYDIYSSLPATLKPGVWTVIQTGLRVEPPEGIWFRLVGRSSSFVRGIHVAEGTIDWGYRGVIDVHAYNTTKEVIEIEQFERVAQLIPQMVIDLDWKSIGPQYLRKTDRGNNGYGSTGS